MLPKTHIKLDKDQDVLVYDGYAFLRHRACKKAVSRHRPGQTVNVVFYDPEREGGSNQTHVRIAYDCECQLTFGIC